MNSNDFVITTNAQTEEYLFRRKRFRYFQNYRFVAHSNVQLVLSPSYTSKALHFHMEK